VGKKLHHKDAAMQDRLVGQKPDFLQKVGFLVADLCPIAVIFAKSFQPDMYNYHDRRHRQGRYYIT
jgi:hypothetical protein